MRRSALVLCTGLLAFICAACIPQPGPPPAPLAAAAATCNFAAKAFWLPAGSNFDPTSGNIPPQGLPVLGTYAYDLNQAFGLAPPAFQAQLCALDGVYLDQTQCNSWSDCIGRSWGLRHRYPSSGLGRYIGLSAALWDDRPAYSEFESRLFSSLLTLSPVSFAANSAADNFWMTVLASLAHEMGHVRWYEIVVPQAANGTYNYDFLQLCGGNFFSSWAGPPGNLRSKPRWRYLLTMQDRRTHPIYDTHRLPPQTNAIDRLGNHPAAGDLVDQIYVPAAPWASFFASLSPDEDFVETYKLAVLTQANPPLTSLAITLPGTQGPHIEDVPADYLNRLKQELADKASCIPPNF